MILLLSPFDNIIDLDKDIRSTTNNDLIEALSLLYDELVAIPEELSQQITEIKFINTVGYTYKIDEKILNLFIKRNNKKSKLLSPILKNASVLNLHNVQELMDYAGSIMDDRAEYIFFDTLISNDLVLYLSSVKYIVGYRLIIKNNIEQWQKIVNVEKYLTICAVFYWQLVSKNEFSEFIDHNKEKFRERFVNIIINKIENENKLKHICLFNTWENEDFHKTISSLNKRFGFFESYLCIKGDHYTLPRNSKRLLILEFNLLSYQAQNRLLKELFDGGYKDCIVIIFTNVVIDIRGYTEIQTWVSPETYLGITKDINDEIIQWSKVIEIKLGEFKSVIEKISTNKKEKIKLNKSLDELSGGKSQFDAYRVDFWYDLESLELYNSNNLKEFAKSINEKYFPEVEKIKYSFIQDGNYWNIIVNDVEEISKSEKKKKQIDISKSKAIRYLVYIIKHTDVNNPIRFDYLSRSVSKWMNGTEKIVKYNTFSESISELFNKYPVLKPMDKYLYYNKRGKGCYYQKNSEIEIDLDGIEIPYIHLENQK